MEKRAKEVKEGRNMFEGARRQGDGENRKGKRKEEENEGRREGREVRSNAKRS